MDYYNKVFFFRTEETNKTEYTVQSGDSLYKIAMANNITVEELMAANNLDNYTIYPNQVLIIPTKITTEGIYFEEYKVKTNDTIDKISKDFNVDKQNILKYNDVTKLKLMPGQIIRLPFNYKTYVVGDKDTIMDILKKTNMTSYELISANETIWLKPGTVINVK